MSSPLNFLRLFADRLRGAGIRFASASELDAVTPPITLLLP